MDVKVKEIVENEIIVTPNNDKQVIALKCKCAINSIFASNIKSNTEKLGGEAIVSHRRIETFVDFVFKQTINHRIHTRLICAGEPSYDDEGPFRVSTSRNELPTKTYLIFFSEVMRFYFHRLQKRS